MRWGQSHLTLVLVLWCVLKLSYGEQRKYALGDAPSYGARARVGFC